MLNTNFSIKGIRSFRKNLDIVIRILKQYRKDDKNQNLAHFTAEEIALADKETTPLLSLRALARNYHIAYSEFKGNTRAQIEVKSDTSPDEHMIGSIKQQMLAALPPAPVLEVA